MRGLHELFADDKKTFSLLLGVHHGIADPVCPEYASVRSVLLLDRDAPTAQRPGDGYTYSTTRESSLSITIPFCLSLSFCNAAI